MAGISFLHGQEQKDVKPSEHKDVIQFRVTPPAAELTEFGGDESSIQFSEDEIYYFVPSVVDHKNKVVSIVIYATPALENGHGRQPLETIQLKKGEEIATARTKRVLKIKLLGVNESVQCSKSSR